MEKRPAPKGAWKKGQSGNPAGKTPGSRNKATQMVMALMEGGAKAIVQQVVKAAKEGDLTAAKLVLDRLAPPVRERAASGGRRRRTDARRGLNAIRHRGEPAPGHRNPGT